MNCPEASDLLFPYLEGEVTPSERTAVQAHLSGCATCQAELGSLSEMQDRVRSSLQLNAAQAAPSAQAWARLENRLAEGAMAAPRWERVRARPERSEGVRDRGEGLRRWTIFTGWRTPRWLPVSMVVLVLAVAAFATVPPLRTLAQDPLGVFRVKRFATVTIEPSTLPVPKGADPTALGSLTITQTPKVSQVGSLGEAQSMVDFPLRSPKSLPAGIGASPKIAVSQEGRFSYTFDLEKARQFLASVGVSASSLPASLDGATLKLTIPAQVAIEYRSQESGPLLLMGQGRSPVLEAPPGLNVDDLRRQLLSLPGLPPELTNQLQALEDWQHTAVIPLPKDKALSKEVTVDGVKGLYLQGNPGTGSALLWQKGDILYGLAGTLTGEALQTAANSLAP